MGMPGGHREADLLLAANATTTAAALVIIFMILLSVAKRPAGGVLGACCTLGVLLPYHGDDLQHAHWMDRPTQVVLVLCVLLLLALLLCAAPQHRNAMDKARRHVSFTLAAALIFFGLVALQLPLDEPLSTRLPEDLASYVPAARPGTWSGQEEETMPFVLMGLAAFCACAAALVTDCWGGARPRPTPARPPAAARAATEGAVVQRQGVAVPQRRLDGGARREEGSAAARGHPARRDPQVDAHVREPRRPGRITRSRRRASRARGEAGGDGVERRARRRLSAMCVRVGGSSETQMM